ncbi:hypothetical protein MY11210_006317 [Beauveria gryllotalpidicola]
MRAPASTQTCTLRCAAAGAASASSRASSSKPHPLESTVWGATDDDPEEAPVSLRPLTSLPHTTRRKPRAGAVGPHARGDGHETPHGQAAALADEARFGGRRGAACCGSGTSVFMQEMFVTTTALCTTLKTTRPVCAAAERSHARLEVLGRARGLHHPCIYPSHAAAGQDVFAGFASGEAAGDSATA